VPTVVAPSLNVIDPVGVPAPGATTVTVAVKITDRLRIDGFAEELTGVVVKALFTVWLNTPEVLPLKLLSPL
jgi:hypothetical protein